MCHSVRFLLAACLDQLAMQITRRPCLDQLYQNIEMKGLLLRILIHLILIDFYVISGLFNYFHLSQTRFFH